MSLRRYVSYSMGCIAVAMFALIGGAPARATETPVAMWGFSEGTGFTATVDSSGNGNAATLSGAAWTTSGKLNKALSFNGTTAKAVVADSASLRQPATALTVSGWIKTNGTSQSGSAVVQKMNATGGASYAIAQSGGTQRSFVGSLQIDGTVYVTPATPQVTNFVWYYAVLSWTSGEALSLELYNANGTLFSRVETAAPISGAISYDESPLYFAENELTNNWKGYVDEVRIFDRKLTAGEIQTDMVTAVPDVLPPTAPASLTATVASAIRVNLSWPAGKDNFAVKGYKIFRDGSYVTSTNARTYSDIGLFGSTTYTYAVSSYDAAGFDSAQTAPVSVTTWVDTVAPVISAMTTSTSPDSAVFTWKTDEPATSVIEYGLTTAYGSRTEVEGLTKTHSVTLTGLMANTRYYYRIVTADIVGNTRYSSRYTIWTQRSSDVTPPVITLVNAQALPNAAVITWTTDELSTSTVRYGLTSSYGSTSSSNAFVTDHAIVLTGLASNGLYHFQVKSQDLAGNVSESEDLTVQIPDTTPPTVSLTTPLQGDTVQGTILIQAAANDNDAIASVQFNIEGTTIGTVYTGPYAVSFDTTTVEDGAHYLSVIASDAAGNFATSSIMVTVHNAPDLTPPVISAINVSPFANTARMTWTTDEDASSIVEYGATTAYGNVVSSTIPVSAHTIVLTGLSPESTYHFRVSSRDAAGNLSVSEDAEFQTSGSLPPDARIRFLHHSTGGVIWSGGIDSYVSAYNGSHGTAYAITEQEFPKDSPYGWNNYPYDYWNIWVNHAGASPYLTEPTLEMLTQQYDVIVWKHCFPVSNISEDTGSPDIASQERTIENYRLQYEALKTKMRQFPGNRFIVWTGAANVAAETDPEQAARARAFFEWVKNVWDEPGDNIFIWDLYEIETGGGNVLLPSYAASSNDSHPNSAFAAIAAPLFGRRLMDVVEGRGDDCDIEGRGACDDPNPPVISAVASSALATSATITWTTDEPATSIVEYGTDGTYGSVVSSTVSVTSHAISLSGLTPETLYHFRVSSGDLAGNLAVGNDLTFQTPAIVIDQTPPVISAVASSALADSATITWTTDEPATSIVEYGTDGTYGSVVSSTVSVTSHAISLSGLTPETLYHFRVSSGDLAGNLAVGSDLTFQTPAEGTVDPGIGPNPPAHLVIAGRTFDPSEPLTPPPAGPGGTTYYVDGANGLDTNDGTSLAPFKTIQRGMNALTNGGDRVLIHAGFYRERVAVYDKDAPNGNPFIIAAYGDGDVIVDGSRAVTGWSAYSGNIYTVRPGFAASSVVIDNQPYYKELSLAALQANPTNPDVPSERRYFYASTGDLYVRTDGGNPETRDVGVLIDNSEQDVVYLWNSNNYVIYGLTVRFGGGRGINTYGSNNTRIERNRVVFNNWTGISTISLDASHSGVNHQIVKNYVYFNFMSNWPRGMDEWVWGGWGSGIGIQGTPAAHVEGNISQKNGGEGILTYLGGGGTVFKNNVSVDNWSVSFYYDNTKNGTIEGNLAICHLPSEADMYSNGHARTSEDYSSALRRLRPIGIMTADEAYGTTPPATLENVMIRNNVIINCKKGLEHYGQATGSGLKNVSVLHNTIIMPSTLHEMEFDNIGISIPYNGGRNASSTYRNNVIVSGGYFGNDTGFLMRSVEEGSMSDLFRGVTIDHNALYQPNPDAPMFRWGGNWGADLSHDQWLALSGAAHGAGDILTNPNLINASSDNVFDKQLSSSSPARDAGVYSGVAYDFLYASRPQGAGYDMGAFESE